MSADDAKFSTRDYVVPPLWSQRAPHNPHIELAVLQASLQIAGTAAAPTVRVLHRDYETRSRAILKTVGTQRYAATPRLKSCAAVTQSMMSL